MKLYFNGCSTTFGDELSNPQKDAWPALVASHLQFDFLNDAAPGGSNDRIVYKVCQHINHHDFFFIVWTTYTRFTEYNPVDNFEINFTPQMALDASSHYSDDLKKNYRKFKTYGEMYYKYWFNELYEFKKWLQQIVLLQSLFKSQGKKYLMLNNTDNHLSIWLQPQNMFIESVRPLLEFFDYLNDDQLLEEHRQIQELDSMIDKSKFIEWNNWVLGDMTKKYPCGPRGHILEDGHQAVAKKVLEYYNNTQ
jgi:hypothetical protein